MSACLSLVLPAVPEAPARARAAITSLCEELGIEPGLAEDIRLAVTEACTNCVLHSYPADAENPAFVLHARVVEGALVVGVRDFGDGLLHARVNEGSGLGLGLIDDLTDDAEAVVPRGGGVRVTMRFAMPSALPALLHLAA